MKYTEWAAMALGLTLVVAWPFTSWGERSLVTSGMLVTLLRAGIVVSVTMFALNPPRLARDLHWLCGWFHLPHLPHPHFHRLRH